MALEKSEKEVRKRIKDEINDPAKEAGLKPIVNFRKGKKKGGAKAMDTSDDGEEDEDEDEEDSSE